MSSPMSARAWEVRKFPSLASTNTYLLDEARAGAPAGVVAVADHQTAGRGRLGRRWESPPGGSLLASVLLRPVAPMPELFACTAAVALAVADACASVAAVQPGIKWPNDLVVADRKLAGLLAESDGAAPGGRPGSVAVVVGVGCNLGWPGPDPATSTSLAAEGAAPVRADDLLAALLGHLAPRVAALDDPDGRRTVIADLRGRCVTLGRRVRVDRGAEPELVGRAAALSPEGHLLVETPAGMLEVTAGDVVHVRAAPGAAPPCTPGAPEAVG